VLGQPQVALEVALGHLHGGAVVRASAEALSASTALRAWLEHLACTSLAAEGSEPASAWVLLDGVLRFAPLTRGEGHTPQTQARAHLAHLLALYQGGLQTPLPFFPRSAWVYATHKRRDSALAAARQVWAGNEEGVFGEAHDSGHRLAWRGAAELLQDPTERHTAAFIALCDAVLGPLLAHMQFSELPRA
jgi:exodeoxyribonuclease V gamma subunit